MHSLWALIANRLSCTCALFHLHVPYFIQKHQTVAFISLDTTSQESNLWQEETVDYLIDRVTLQAQFFKKLPFGDLQLCNGRHQKILVAKKNQ